MEIFKSNGMDFLQWNDKIEEPETFSVLVQRMRLVTV